MLAAIDLRVYSKNDVKLPHPCAHLVKTALLEVLGSVDASILSDLQGSLQEKPFAISTLWSNTLVSDDDMLEIPKYTECRLRICTLTRPVFEAISNAIFSRLAVGGSIQLGSYDFILMKAKMELPFGRVTSFSDLLRDHGDEINLRFTSPTVFYRDGINVPLPDPILVYSSLWQKWKAFSDKEVPESVFEEMLSAVSICRIYGRTHTWKFPQSYITGFVGLAGYELIGNVSKEVRDLFGALSALAFYSGIGYLTDMGMGQCRVVESEGIDYECSAADQASAEHESEPCSPN
jgi:CRISPR-associated endoribonuclease Cas6